MSGRAIVLLIGAFCASLAGAASARAQEAAGAKETAPWWPSEFGADDQRGAVNRITPAKVLEATALVTEGRVYPLGQTYEPGMPLFGTRHYSLTIPGAPTGEAQGANAVVYNDELVSGQIGQIGTQFDGLGHIGQRVDGEDYFYNGVRGSDMYAATGLRKLGIENVGPIVTRGVLIDVAAHKGVDRLESGYVITPEDLQAALAAQGVELRPGDAVFTRTGHAALWMVDNEAYNAGEPGIGVAAAEWLIGRQVVLTGTDNWAGEVLPSEDPSQAFPVHQMLLMRNGIYNLENLNLDALAGGEVWEFLFMFSPVPFKGATGSPGNPIAIR